MIPICRPLLPTSDKLMPYIHRIDESRHYTNFSPLCREYEERLSNHFGAYVVSTSSGTQALVATLIALDFLPGQLVTCPAFTFAATPGAIVSAGYTPFFVDVNEDTWGADKSNLPSVGVMPFGLPIDGDFDVIDAAAGFDTVTASNIPQIISTHATKSFSTGEGGVVVCKNKHLIDRIRIIINHGISPDRSISVRGINAKMSGYHAAVGLASLDEWPERRERWKCVGNWYGAGEYAISTHIIKLKSSAATMATHLKKHGIDTRLSWYDCATQPAYLRFPRRNLPITEDLIEKTIALPFYSDMKKKDVDYILEKLNA